MRAGLVLAAALAMAGVAQAQENTHTEAPALREPGQGAFASIQEVVTLLSADPSTDWSTVNIERLRQHLIDMDEVTLHAAVRAEEIPGGARFAVSGEGRTRDAIHNMVVSHVRSMGEDAHWTLGVEETPDGAIVTALGWTPEDEQRIRALGLIGIMSAGGHHQPHHLLLATGANPHH